VSSDVVQFEAYPRYVRSHHVARVEGFFRVAVKIRADRDPVRHVALPKDREVEAVPFEGNEDDRRAVFSKKNPDQRGNLPPHLDNQVSEPAELFRWEANSGEMTNSTGRAATPRIATRCFS
jgi:hypothetical protein